MNDYSRYEWAVPTEGEFRAIACRFVLDQLPQWFGRPEAVARYVEAVAGMTTYVALERDGDGKIAGFISLDQTNENALDVHVMGVVPAHHHRGAGKMLIERAHVYAKRVNASYLTVQTLGPSHPDEYYARTRRFYRACGFVEVMEFRDHWDEGTPMALMVRSVG